MLALATAYSFIQRCGIKRITEIITSTAMLLTTLIWLWDALSGDDYGMIHQGSKLVQMSLGFSIVTTNIPEYSKFFANFTREETAHSVLFRQTVI
jgi:hypothetical protein